MRAARQFWFGPWAALLLLAAGGATSARAADEVVLEQPSPRQGYFIGLGLYGLSSVTNEKGDTLGPFFGSGYSLRLGQMVTRRFGLALSFDTGASQGTAEGRKQIAAMTGLSTEGQFAITPRLAVHGGVGVGFAQIAFTKKMPEDDDSLRGTYGSYYLLGISYDFFPKKSPVSGGFAITPTVRVRFIPGDTVDALGIFFGVDLLWWSGLPHDQLDLPPDKAFEKKR